MLDVVSLAVDVDADVVPEEEVSSVVAVPVVVAVVVSVFDSVDVCSEVLAVEPSAKTKCRWMTELCHLIIPLPPQPLIFVSRPTIPHPSRTEAGYGFPPLPNISPTKWT